MPWLSFIGGKNGSKRKPTTQKIPSCIKTTNQREFSFFQSLAKDDGKKKKKKKQQQQQQQQKTTHTHTKKKKNPQRI